MLSTIYNKQEFSGMCVVQVQVQRFRVNTSFVLGEWHWIYCKTLFTWSSNIVRTYISYQVFSSHVNSTHVTQSIEMALCGEY